jgi:hypothetical protein
MTIGGYLRQPEKRKKLFLGIIRCTGSSLYQECGILLCKYKEQYVLLYFVKQSNTFDKKYIFLKSQLYVEHVGVCG